MYIDINFLLCYNISIKGVVLLIIHYKKWSCLMANNKKVVQSWAKGEKSKSSSYGAIHRFHTDGSFLYSYSLMIGYVAKNGNRVVIDYTGNDRYSVTTSKHVNMAKPHAHRIVSAEEYDPSDVKE